MKALKIIGWTLLGIVLAVVAAVTIACYVIFTPERLTPIARKAADAYLTCEHEIGQVDLTFISTFPRFGLRADGLLIINPKAGSRNDTVLEARTLIAIVDVMEFLNNSNLHVHEAVLEGTRVNFFIAEDGTTNLTDIFLSQPDTTAEDTSAFSLPFNALRVDGLSLQADYITFVDAKDTISASLGQTVLSAKAESWDDMLIALDAHDVCASLQGDTYADNLHLELIAPMAMDLNTMHFAFDGAKLAVNEFDIRLQGDVTLGDSIALNANIQTGKWQIKPLLALVPDKFTEALQDLDIDGRATLDATIQGYLSENRMPLVQARLTLDEGVGSYEPLPYTLRDLTLDVEADLNLNKGQKSNAVIHKLHAATRNSQLSVLNAQVSDILGDMFLDLALKLDANLPDFAYFLPEEMALDGKAQGTMKVRGRLADLTQMRLHKGKINADLQLTDIHYAMDSMLAYLPATRAVLHIPNPNPSKTKANWVRLDLQAQGVDFEMIDQLKANLRTSAVQLEASNVLSNDPMIYASVGLQTEQQVVAELDSMGGQLDAPQLQLYAEYNTKDTVRLHKAEMALACNALNGFANEIKATLGQSQLSAAVSGGKRLTAQLRTTALDAAMGQELQARTKDLALEVGARYNKRGENVLLKWNPKLKVNLNSGALTMPERLPETVKIPSIDFSYSNREMAINNARVELGNSDLNLKGNVRNIGRWFRHQAVLQGELDIVSDHCDANQLLEWFSADSGSEETPKEEKENIATANANADTTADPTATANANANANADTTANADPDPFLVPTDVDLALNTHMREVAIFNQVAKDLKGGLYIKNGEVILDEMGFVCRAAKLQLTAIYKTPRRNHIFVGFDYHMIDVDIDELLSMIPDLEQMVPMLSSFKGSAQFHLALETFTNSQYKPKMSTLRGAASLTGKDLVVLDGKTFSKISKLLLFKKKTENKIDSINAEITIYKDEIDVYPLCVQMDKYTVALGGRHKTDMTFDYDINVLSPIYLGVHVGGTLDNLKIKLAKCKYAKDFRPHWYQKADTQSLEMRKIIKESMEKNVRIQ